MLVGLQVAGGQQRMLWAMVANSIRSEGEPLKYSSLTNTHFCLCTVAPILTAPTRCPDPTRFTIWALLV